MNGIQKEKVCAPRADKPVESWSVAQSGARKYAAQKPWKVILYAEESVSARDISPLVRSVKELIISPNPAMPLVTDGEAVFCSDTRFEVLRVENRENPSEKGGEIYVYVRELL